jgi:hypothetical protein
MLGFFMPVILINAGFLPQWLRLGSLFAGSSIKITLTLRLRLAQRSDRPVLVRIAQFASQFSILCYLQKHSNLTHQTAGQKKQKLACAHFVPKVCPKISNIDVVVV